MAFRFPILALNFTFLIKDSTPNNTPPILIKEPLDSKHAASRGETQSCASSAPDSGLANAQEEKTGRGLRRNQS